MTNRVTTEQITLLRRMMCYLACYPDRHTPAGLAQVLRQLVDGLNLDAAGVYWQTDGQLQPLAHWPPRFTPPPPGATNGSVPAPGQPTTIPMRCDGATLGQLWLTASRPLTPAEQDLITLVANQLAFTWQNSRLYRQLASLAERRGELLRRLIEVDEQCSRRVSRELHDEISQSLTVARPPSVIDWLMTPTLRYRPNQSFKNSCIRGRDILIRSDKHTISETKVGPTRCHSVNSTSHPGSVSHRPGSVRVTCPQRQ